ncbi:putative isomerase YddE [compost metagenome]
MSRLFHVNAFSQHPFGGNPAIVVLGPERSDAELQAMAAEFNLSETAFLSPLGEAHYRLRWFTPQVEVDLCGHGTLAAAHVLWQTGTVARSRALRFETRSGLLEACAEGEWIRLDFPRIPLAPLTLDPAYAKALGCTPSLLR